MSVEIHVVGVGLVDDPVNGDGRTFLIVKGEVPPLTAAAAPIQSQISSVVHVESGVAVPLRERARLCTCIRKDESGEKYM